MPRPSEIKDSSFDDLDDRTVIDFLRETPGDIELTRPLHRRIARMCDRCYTEALQVVCKKHNHYNQ